MTVPTAPTPSMTAPITVPKTVPTVPKTVPKTASLRSVRVELPAHLRQLAGVGQEFSLAVAAPVTHRSLLDALERAYPMLEGTIRDHTTGARRPFLRFFACQQDLSHADADEPIPDAVAEGREPYLILGAIAGGSY